MWTDKYKLTFKTPVICNIKIKKKKIVCQIKEKFISNKYVLVKIILKFYELEQFELDEVSAILAQIHYNMMYF